MNRLLRLAAALMFLGCTALRAQEAWTATASSTTQNLWSVCYGAGQFVAVGEGGTILTSADGLAWTKRVSGNTLWLVGAGYGNGLFVAVGDQGTILTSPDGVTWIGRPSGTTARINGVAYGGGRWVAVAESGELLTSTDATTWSKLSPSADRLRGLIYAYGEFVITGDNGLMRVTIDTTDYDSRVLPDGLFVESVVYARRSFLAVGEAGYAIASADAVTWQRIATGTSAYLRGVTFFNGQFIAVGENGTVLTTADATGAWTPRAAGTTALFTAASSSDAAAVVIGFGGTIIRSAPASAAPSIATAPASSIAAAGDNVLFGFTAIGSLPLSYQWSFNGQPLAGQTTDQLLVSNVQPAQAGAYTVTVTNSRGSTASPPATLSLVTSTAPGPIVDTTFTPTFTISGSIAAVVEQADGKVIIGGSQFFVTLGVSPFALARLNLDGSLDPTFNIGSGLNAGGTVSQLALQPDGKILVAGNFSTFNGVARRNLLRLNSDGTVDSSFTAANAVTGSIPTQVTVQPDGRILLLSATRVYRLNSDGAPDPAFIGPTNGVVASRLALLPTGRVLVNDRAGLNSGEPDRIRRLDSGGAIDSTFATIIAPSAAMTSISARVVDLRAFEDGRAFYSVRSATFRGDFVYASTFVLTVDGTRDLAWRGLSITGSGYGTFATTYAVTPSGMIFQAESHFAESSHPGNSIPTRSFRRFNADASSDFSLDARSGPNGDVNGIIPLRDGRTIVFGEFTTFDAVARPKLVRLVAANALAAQSPVIISATPEAAAVRPGEPVTVTVLAAGSGPLAFASTLGTPVAIGGGVTISIPTKISGTYNFTLSVTNRAGSVSTTPVRVVVAPSAPVVLAQPVSVTARVGQSAVFSADAGGTAPFTFEWFRGATSVGAGPTLTISNVSASSVGDYTVVVRNSLGATTSQVARLTVDIGARLTNISTRASVAPGEQILIAGFVISGTGKKDVLIRGAGPALSVFGLSGLLPNPTITLFDSAGRTVAINDNWDASSGSLFASAGAFGFPNGSVDAALRASLDPGAYTLHVTDTAGRGGIALAEIYETDSTSARLANLSSRASVGTGANVAISGIVVQGQQSGRFLVRGIGPSLGQFGITGALADPVLTLTTATGATVATNDNWATNANAAEIVPASVQVGAFPLNATSRDAVLLVTLAPGNYTALVSGANNTSGVVLVEVYEIP